MRKRKRTSDLRRRTSIRSGGRCIRRSRGARVARSLKSDVGSRENARVLSPRRLFLTRSRRGAEDAEVRLKKRTGKVPAGLISIEDVLSAPMPSPDGSPVPIPIGRSGEDFSFGFSTKYHDREVGLVAYQLRSYSPALGCWLNRDPIEEEGGVNLYGFLGNNQICITDVLGLLPYQYQTTVWGTYWYPQPRRPKSPDRQPRISYFGTFLESILDFLFCNSGTTYYYYYPQHSATVRLLKHPQVAKVWKLFKSIKNPGAYSRGKIHYKATKFDYCMDVITFFNTNPMALVMPMPKISLETISNIMAFDVGYQALGSFDGEYTIKTNFDMCTKTLDMKLWNTWSLVSLTRNPFSERRSSFLSQETFERESHFWSDIKQFYIYFVVEPITRVEMWAR